MSLVVDNVRSLHDLYLLLYDYMKSKNLPIYGICEHINSLYLEDRISLDEHYLLMGHFRSNRPSLDKHIDFYVASMVDKAYWFPLGPSGFSMRLRFLKKMIEITKNK